MTDGITLELLDPDQLVPAPRHDELEVVELSADEAGRLAPLYRQIWAPIGGGGRSDWTTVQWREECAKPGMSAWIATIRSDEVGMAQLGWSGSGDAGIVVIGVLPGCQGQGLGADLLTRLTRRLWDSPAPNGRRTERVWIWTVPDEHPHTVANYLARGYRIAPR